MREPCDGRASRPVDRVDVLQLDKKGKKECRPMSLGPLTLKSLLSRLRRIWKLGRSGRAPSLAAQLGKLWRCPELSYKSIVDSIPSCSKSLGTSSSYLLKHLMQPLAPVKSSLSHPVTFAPEGLSELVCRTAEVLASNHPIQPLGELAAMAAIGGMSGTLTLDICLESKGFCH